MYFLIMLYNTKKNKDTIDTIGVHRHKKVEEGTQFFVSITILITIYNDKNKEFNFLVDKSTDPYCKFLFFLINYY